MKEALNEQKKQLLALRENYKQTLLGEVKELKTDIIQTKNWVLLAGGTIIIAYVGIKVLSSIFSIFTGGKETEKVKEIIIEKPYQVYDSKKIEKESFLSPIISAIKQEIRLFLLSLAKQALRDFIENMKAKTKNS
jgi:vacuolar-type H+-ATPase subunit E/Vma4